MSYFSSALQASGNLRYAGDALTDEQLRWHAPSAFAAEAHASRSARYTYIPTSAAIDGLRRNGFFPVAAKQSRTRDMSRREFTKHMVRFRHQGQVQRVKTVGDTFPEIVLVNSHDGSSSYEIMAGLFRLVCLNGMVVSDKTFDAVKVPHKGDIVDQVIEGSYTVLERSQQALEGASAWVEVVLSRNEQYAMAEAARVLRFGDAEGNTDTPVSPDHLLAARRAQDAGSDLWRVFNRLQENAIRGGLTALGRDAAGRRKRVTTRPVTGIDQDVKLNRALWVLGERMAALKAAA